jgi:hypothetical protein
MESTTTILKYSETQSLSNNGYAYAFGMAWASLSKTAQKKLIRYCEEELKKLEEQK